METKEKNTGGLVKQMKTISSSFTSMKIITISSIIAIFLTALGGFYLYTKGYKELSSQIYVLDNGAAFSASSQDASITRKDEINDHVLRFHELMFNVPPNRDMIRSNLERALDLADRSAYNYYNDLQETGFYNRLVQNNAYQQMDVESVEINMDSYPYEVILRGYQYVNRESNVSQYTLVTRCKVLNAPRTKVNLHGLMINDFNVIENRLVETRNK